MIIKKNVAKFLLVSLIAVSYFSCTKEEVIEGDNSCSFTQWTGTGSCANGYPVYTGKCAPAGYPFYNTATDYCYTSCSAAYEANPSGSIYRSNENGNTSGSGSGSGTGSGSGSGSGSGTPSCASWNSSVSVTTSWINNCGSKDDLSVKVTNNSQQKLAIRIAIKKKNGVWDCGLQYGVASGKTSTYYSCHASGDYRVTTMLQTDNDKGCKFPTCGQ